MGWRVLITRPEPLASRWQTWLAGEQVNACVVSVMELVPVGDTSAREAIKKVVLDFDHYHKAVFVSQNAVHEAMRWLDEYWPALPVGVEYLAIGEATAAALAEYDITAAALGSAEGAMNSEALLQSPILQQVYEQKVVIFRGVGGRDLMRQTLTARGARVEYCELYQREIPPMAAAALAEALATSTEQLLVSVHSGESLQHLLSVAEAAGVLPTLKQLPLIVPALRVAMQASELGFSSVFSAENASNGAMLSAIKRAMHTA